MTKLMRLFAILLCALLLLSTPLEGLAEHLSLIGEQEELVFLEDPTDTSQIPPGDNLKEEESPGGPKPEAPNQNDPADVGGGGSPDNGESKGPAPDTKPLSARLVCDDKVVTAGLPAKWHISAKGGAAPYVYTISIFTPDSSTPYMELPAQHSHKLEWTFTETGVYYFSITITDNEGAHILLTGDRFKVLPAGHTPAGDPPPDEQEDLSDKTDPLGDEEGFDAGFQAGLTLSINETEGFGFPPEASPINFPNTGLTDSEGQLPGLTVTAADLLQEEPLRVTLDNPNRTISTGVEVNWAAEAQGGVEPYAYAFNIRTNTEEHQAYQLSPNEWCYAFYDDGDYTIEVIVTDAAGHCETAQSAIRVTSPAPLVFTSSLDINSISDLNVWKGEGIAAQGWLEGSVIPRALLNQLSAAYVSFTSTFLQKGIPATWTCKAVGGDGVYQFQFQVVKASRIQGNTTYGVFEYTTPVTRDPVFTYAIKSDVEPYYYWLNVMITDERNRYVVYQTRMFDVAKPEMLQNAKTVPGKVKQIVASLIKPGMSDREKAAVLHDWLTHNAKYDYSFTYYHADGVLLYGKGVCNSFTEAYRMLCAEAGIPCLTLNSATQNHAWNVVMVDGEWYHVDVTWNAVSPPSRKYFLLKDNEIAKDHYWSSDPLGPFPFSGIFQTGKGAAVVETLRLSPEKLNIAVGATLVLSVSFLPTNATAPKLTWSSSNTSAVRVDSSGRITAAAPGQAVITVTTQHGVKAQTTLTVVTTTAGGTTTYQAVTGVKLNTSAVNLAIGKTYQLTATIAPSNATINDKLFTSSNTNVATVSTTGLITARNTGTAVITVRTADGHKTAACSVSVPVPITGYYLPEKLPAKAIKGNIFAVQLPAGAKSLSIVSANSSVASVSGSNIVFKASGKVKLTINYLPAGAKKPKKVTKTITVTTKVTDISIKTISATLPRGGKITLNASVSPSDASLKTVIWTTSNKTIATVSSKGVVTGKAPGLCTITATTKDGGYTAKVMITVSPLYEQSVKLNKTALSLLKGKTFQLKAAFTPAKTDFKLIKWTSSNPAVASVNEAGRITANQPGVCVVTATSVNGKKAACQVTIWPQRVTAVKIGVVPANQSVGSVVRLAVTVTPANADNKALRYTTSNPAIATVNASGQVTFIRPGTVTLTVTAADGSNKSASKKFTVK